MTEVNKKCNILFIDDSHTEIRYLKLFFQINDFPVNPNFINSAQEALEELGTLAKEDFPEVIIVDINMPLMNGFEFATAYYERYFSDHSDTNLFIYSTSINSADISKAESISGITSFINKPFDENTFNNKILPHLKLKKAVES